MDLLEEFKKAVSNLFGEKPNIIFVGMSNIGKTHWSKRLAQSLKMKRIDFDGLIGQSAAMQELIKGISGKDEAEQMGIYFNMPWTNGFNDREKNFLNAEEIVMEDNSNQFDTIFDLTGSAFLHEEAMNKIADSGLVIYLQASAEEQEQALTGLLKDFKEGPKPVCWGKIPKPKNEEELKQRFKELLSYRAENYAIYSDIIIPYEVHNRYGGKIKSAQDLVVYVLNELKTNPPKLKSRQLI